ncbi:MAG: hypothetical protein ACKOW9_06160 [Candidatus Paceibacterota bacterium]
MFNSVPGFIPALLSSRQCIDISDHVFNGYDFNGASEVSIDSLREFSDSFADDCVRYWALCTSFWDDLKDESSNDVLGLVTTRELGAYHVIDRKDERLYLSKQFEELRNTPLVDALLQVTGSEFDINNLSSLHSVKDVQVNDGIISLNLEYRGRKIWSNALGGVPSRGEIGRLFSLKISHAKWRDSRVKRLLEVKVQAVEVLPQVWK